MIEASGWSYLLEQSVGDTGALVRAIEGSAAGFVVLDPTVVSGLKPLQGSFSTRLTPRQREVLALMAEGYNNAAIAEKLVLGLKSVENYVNAIYQELSFTDGADVSSAGGRRVDLHQRELRLAGVHFVDTGRRRRGASEAASPPSGPDGCPAGPAPRPLLRPPVSSPLAAPFRGHLCLDRG